MAGIGNGAMIFALALVTVVPSGQSFDCTPTRVWDGDGPIWCQEGPHVRLAGIAAKEMNGTCNANQPCPDAAAEVARDALASLIGTPQGQSPQGHVMLTGPKMTCRSDGGAGGNRTAAWCISPKSGDVNCKMVKGGWALVWDRYWRGHKCD